ncbi:hypothetical protein [Pseudoalteromonas sp. T1lg76]|uniref:hypothetical protein n=1 Tax=Pseudoalteromonas sp. T1lg76 TaxID=2077103 RepID=UPI000CF5F8D1|nr:hypothetical protein [Pseudoalteromonas sp. T1lg76]
MKKFLLIALLAGGYYFYSISTENGHERIFDVANNPIPTSEYIKLRETQAIKMCETNAQSYNIDVNVCPKYISSKFPECKSKLPRDLPDFIDSKTVGVQVTSKYFECIAPWPHCNGKEIKNEFDARQFCKSI